MMRHVLQYRRGVPCSFALGLLIALGLTSSALATHPRPGNASPNRVALVTAFAPCTAPNATHPTAIPGVSLSSCNPPVLESAILTTQASGAGGGFVRLDTFCNGGAPGETPPCSTTAGDQEDINLAGTITDVSCRVALTSPPFGFTCGANGDYANQVAFDFPMRLTDHYNQPATCTVATGVGCTTATVSDLTLGIPVSCLPDATPPTPPGSTCNLSTTVDALAGNTVVEGQRQALRAWDEIFVSDPGPDGSFGSFCPPFCYGGAQPTVPTAAVGGTGDEGITRAAGQFAP
jgi:hypothetical protein